MSPLHAHFQANSLEVAPLRLTHSPENGHKLGTSSDEKQFLDSLMQIRPVRLRNTYGLKLLYICSNTFTPSIAALIIPPAYPAPSPQG